MTGGSNPASLPPARAAATALAVTLALQMFTSLAATATSVLAPMIASDLDLSPNLIGVFVGIIYVGSMAGSLAAGGFVERFGAIRVSQTCVLLCAASLAAVCAGAAPPSSLVVLLALAPLALGLGYGPITPASSHVLVRTAPPSRMALTFSIKQTGVPAGAAVAGALLPGLALAQGWRATYLAIAALGIVIVIAAEPTRARLDDDRQPGRAISLAGVFAPLKIVIGSRALAELAMTGFFYAATQVCLSSFLVIYLTETLHFGIVAAGLALTVANVGGIVGRITWGGTADRWVPPRVLLGSIGVVAASCAFATAAFGAGWPLALDLRGVRLFRRDRNRLERRSAGRDRAPIAVRPGGNGDRRIGLHHIRRSRRRAAGLCAARDGDRKLPGRVHRVRKREPPLRDSIAAWQAPVIRASPQADCGKIKMEIISILR